MLPRRPGAHRQGLGPGRRLAHRGAGISAEAAGEDLGRNLLLARDPAPESTAQGHFYPFPPLC